MAVDNARGTTGHCARVSRMPAFDPTVPFTRADARRAGVSETELRGPSYRRLFYDLYVAAHLPVTPRLLGRAAVSMSAAGSVVSHHTAGRMWDGVVPDHPATHVSVPSPGHRSRRRGVKAHLLNPDAEVVTIGGLAVSSPRQSFLDLASEAELVDLLVLGDSLVRARRTTPAELVQAAEGWCGSGARLARRAACLVRTGVDSPMETRLRLLLVLAGLPEPVVNHIVRDDSGNWQWRFDLCYPQVRLIVEYDGRQHADDKRQWTKDVRRREWLDEEGWRIIVVLSGGIYIEPEETLLRVHRVLRERDCPDLPRRLNDEWRRYFPGRRAT